MHSKPVFQLLVVLVVLVLGPSVTLGNGAATNGSSPTPSGGGDQWPKEWSYDGSGSTEFWDEINPTNHSLCGSGQEQSPINVGNDNETKDSVVEKPLDAINITWPKSTNFTNSSLILKNFGYTLQVMGAFGDNYTTEYLGQDFKLLQFHFHTPSEHHVSGDFTPLEVHFVHKTDDGQLAVLGIMMEIANNSKVKSKFLDSIVPLLQDVPKSNTSTPVPYLDLYKALKEANGLKKGFYTYNGSLTTPPCTQSVNWVLAKDKMKVSGYQFNAIRSLIKYSARDTQQRNFPPETPPKAASTTSSPAISLLVPAVLVALALNRFFSPLF